LADALARLQQLAQTEKLDLQPMLNDVRLREDRAQAAVLAGRFDDAVAADDEGTALGRGALEKTAGKLIAEYRRVAHQAVEAKRLGLAQEALDRAKALEVLAAQPGR